MLFNSYIFILLFLPLALCGYYLFNKIGYNTISKIWLLFFSLWFYGYFNIKYLPIIVISIVLNYFSYLYFQASENITLRKLLLSVDLIINIGCLFVFKYLGFLTETVNSIFSADFFVIKVVLPLGISFFTFQQVSFVIDSYKNDVPSYNFIDYALFVVFFPQLIAGPIVLHDEIIPQFNNKNNQIFNSEKFAKGIYAFAFGLAKKVLIADTVGNAVNLAFNDTDYFLNTTNGIIIMLAYTMQIYFDFSGYCDMSTGLGLMFNIKIPMNFNSPYRSLDIIDFWKRWHITLTRFFTKYLYIPLGGNRKGKARTYVNNFITFFVSGIWHGANWTFILWGSIHGAGIVFNKIFKSKINKIPVILRWCVTFVFINFTWLLFRADSIYQFFFIMKHLFSFNFHPISSEITESFINNNLLFIFDKIGFANIKLAFVLLLLVLILLASVFMKNTSEKLNSFKPSRKNAVISSVLLFLSIVSFSGISTFLYFNF